MEKNMAQNEIQKFNQEHDCVMAKYFDCFTNECDPNPFTEQAAETLYKQFGEFGCAFISVQENKNLIDDIVKRSRYRYFPLYEKKETDDGIEYVPNLFVFSCKVNLTVSEKDFPEDFEQFRNFISETESRYESSKATVMEKPSLEDFTSKCGCFTNPNPTTYGERYCRHASGEILPCHIGIQGFISSSKSCHG